MRAVERKGSGSKTSRSRSRSRSRPATQPTSGPANKEPELLTVEQNGPNIGDSWGFMG